ncbi:hypothetical protein D3C86_1889700 [compost metagenome]
MKVVGGVAFAEQQPVALFSLGDAGLEQAAQPGEAGAVTQQNHRRARLRQMKATVAAYAQADCRAHWRVFGQPTRTQAEAAIGMAFLTNDQLEPTVGGN